MDHQGCRRKVVSSRIVKTRSYQEGWEGFGETSFAPRANRTAKVLGVSAICQVTRSTFSDGRWLHDRLAENPERSRTVLRPQGPGRRRTPRPAGAARSAAMRAGAASTGHGAFGTAPAGGGHCGITEGVGAATGPRARSQWPGV